MATLEGLPGAYHIPSRGEVITKTGLIVGHPDELAYEWYPYGFVVVQWDGSTAPVVETSIPSAPPKEVVGLSGNEALDYMKDKAFEEKTQVILTTQGFQGVKKPSSKKKG